MPLPRRRPASSKPANEGSPPQPPKAAEIWIWTQAAAPGRNRRASSIRLHRHGASIATAPPPGAAAVVPPGNASARRLCTGRLSRANH
ncbi:hypothetical protein ZWY2020_007786 [Hordeum vulgare]|nr:hypothetical protein ZWY2020_007786 [Hordeum vulgare]